MRRFESRMTWVVLFTVSICKATHKQTHAPAVPSDISHALPIEVLNGPRPRLHGLAIDGAVAPLVDIEGVLGDLEGRELDAGLDPMLREARPPSGQLA